MERADREEFEEFVELMDSLLEVSTIVEGCNDRRALESLGFSDVHVLDEPVYKVAERFSKKDRVQILTDFDRAGKRLFCELRHLLCQRGVDLQRELRLAVKETGVTQVEDLAVFVNRRWRRASLSG